MSEIIVNRDQAKLDFDRFVDAMRIDMELEGLDDNTQREKGADRAKVINAIMDGRLVIEDDGIPVFTPPGGKPVRWSYPTGRCYTAMDRAKDTAPMAKMLRSMAQITGTPEIDFNKMHLADLQVCMSIWNLFLA